ncbi:MAG: hypothetical protein FWG89_05860 [Treponema sp.]|nr:hypothetical protein [Treponema sp.]
MKDFENELDEIRIKLYEETRGLDTKEIINSVNSHARSIAYEFGINIKNTINEKYLQTVNL